MKANEMYYFSNLFDKVLYTFRRSPLSIIRSTWTLYTRTRYLSCQFCWLSAIVVRMDHASRQPSELTWQIPIACIQCWDTPDDGQWISPKHVKYFIK